MQQRSPLPKWAGVVEIDGQRHRVGWARLEDAFLGHALKMGGASLENVQRISEFVARVVPSLTPERIAQLTPPELIAIVNASTGGYGKQEAKR